MRNYWNERKGDFLKQLVSLTGLGWKQTRIPCYIVAAEQSWSSSDPLMIPLAAYTRMGADYFFFSLQHELIHILLLDNFEDENLSGENWVRDWLEQRYPAESNLCGGHVLVHAIHACLHRGDIGQIQIAKHPEYRRSWEIIEEEGAINIVEEFRAFALARNPVS
ncbi:MAG: hypothetical protein ABIG08_02220 [bacterium]